MKKFLMLGLIVAMGSVSMADVQRNEDNITALDNTIQANRTDINGNSNNIVINANNIAKFKDNSVKVDNNTGSIKHIYTVTGGLDERLRENGDNTALNTVARWSSTKSIEQNKVGIANLGSKDLIINAKTIINKFDIGKNRLELTKNTNSIMENRGRIDSNSRAVSRLGSKISDIENNMSSGISGVSAMANLDFDSIEVGNVAVGVGVGFFNGSQSVAVGVGYRHNENVSMRGSVAYDGEEPVFGYGATYQFNPSDLLGGL